MENRTGAWSVWATSIDLSTNPETSSMTSGSLAPTTATAAASVKDPMNTLHRSNTACSLGVSKR